jgi:membrane protease subunit HflC
VTLANAYKDAEALRGEGDGKASEIYAKAYGQDPEFYSFYRSLNVYRDSFSNGGDMLVLEPSSPFFKYFRGGGQ